MMLFVLLVAFGVLIPQALTNNITTGHAIVKRHLRWNANKYIVSRISHWNNIQIDYLQPHSRSVGVSETSAVYMAFTLYMRKGRWIIPNTGVFHVIDLDTAAKFRSKCTPSTNHSGAYYHFYGTCPSADAFIVASGWCYGGASGLVYNSYTFNSAPATYMNGQYYLNTDRTVNSYEIPLISYCYNAWKNSGFPVKSWKCSTSNIPVTGGRRSKRSFGDCNSCDCLTSKAPLPFRGRVRDSVHVVFVCVISFLAVPRI